MNKAVVYVYGAVAGLLEQAEDGHYIFSYSDEYFARPDAPPISLSLPKSQKIYRSNLLFPFFCGLLSEGVNKDIQCRMLKVDERDDFARLLLVGALDPVGAVTVKPVVE
jgi:serine/threonine-protein kinase HipA